VDVKCGAGQLTRLFKIAHQKTFLDGVELHSTLPIKQMMHGLSVTAQNWTILHRGGHQQRHRQTFKASPVGILLACSKTVGVSS
jgi:gluconate kinase